MRPKKKERLLENYGTTLIEVLVAMTLIFIAITVTLRLQSMLANKLGTRQLEYAISAADSLMVAVMSDSTLSDTTFVLPLSAHSLLGLINVDTKVGMRRIRVTLNDSATSKEVHTLYYEEEINN